MPLCGSKFTGSFLFLISNQKFLRWKKIRRNSHRLFVTLHFIISKYNSVSDPGFPVGGRRPRGGDANSRGGYVSKNLYVKTKESGPLGARTDGAPWIRQCKYS